MNKLTIIDAEELAKRNRSFYLWAFLAEIIWLVMGVIIGMKYGDIIMGIIK